MTGTAPGRSKSVADPAAMTESQHHILCHSLGLDDHGRGNSYRRHFVTGKGSKDYDDCMALVSLGFMERRDGSPLTGGGDLFLVTESGRLAVRAELERKSDASQG